MAYARDQDIALRDLAQGGVANAGAAVVASLAGLAIVLLAGRSMTPAEYASFAAIWGLVFGCAAVVGALEPELARVRSLAPGPIDGTQLAATVIVAVGAALGMAAITISLFDELHLQSGLVAALVVATAAVFPSMFAARGFLAGSMRLLSLSAVTVSESLVRLTVVLLGLWAAAATVPTFAVGALCGALVGLPTLVRHSKRMRGPVALGPLLRRTGTLMAGNAMSALLVTGAPVLVGLSMAGATAAEVGRMQAGVVISRFPLMALMLLQSLLVPVFVRRESLYRGGDYRRILLILVIAIPIATLASYLGGSWLLAVLYGLDYLLEPGQIALLTLGATALGGVQVLIALAVAGDQHRLAPMAFAPMLAVTAMLAFLPLVPLPMRIPVALALGPTTGFLVAVSATAHWRRLR